MFYLSVKLCVTRYTKKSIVLEKLNDFDEVTVISHDFKLW